MTMATTISQPIEPAFCTIQAAVALMATAGSEGRGAVFTRREVVDFILDLSGYTPDKPLHKMRLLEPAVGLGDFLIPVIDRLFAAYGEVVKKGNVVEDLSDCLCAVELHQATYVKTCSTIHKLLREKGLSAKQSAALRQHWLRQGDFLLTPLEGKFTHVIGNPPYVRQELIPDALMAEYRRRFHTIYDRADIYIPFIERSLSLLAPSGVLGFICADRWMKNRYGGPLRRFVAENFNLRYFVDMVDTNAFLSDVIAYPAIIVIGREKPGLTRVAHRPTVEAMELHSISRAMTARKLPKNSNVISEISSVANGAEPWMLETPGHMQLMRRLETDFPIIEETGCKVGIGVATGADKVFIGPFDELDVEPDRKLPLVMTQDILNGTIDWQGFGIINPFAVDGKLVPLSSYPKLAAYLERNKAVIKGRHVSKKNPSAWYRTIDRIYPELTKVPKLLIPDIKGEAHIVYDPGRLYPHHNLYFVTSSVWDLHALQAVLLSDVTRMFITNYSTKMRGGYLRFQAQYLRRIRVPLWRDVPSALRNKLKRAGLSRDPDACNVAVTDLYSLTTLEKQALEETKKVENVA
jgi:hypothetical protein